MSTTFEQKSTNFWDQQTSSLHRDDETTFYVKKAQEHIAIVRQYGADTEAIVDVGCGFGELVEQYFKFGLPIAEGIDTAKNAIKIAQKKCQHLAVNLVHSEDTLAYVAQSDKSTFLACGSINQYLPAEQLGTLLSNFANNRHARSFFMFDCVDPIRYAVHRSDISYSKPKVRTGLVGKLKGYILKHFLPAMQLLVPMSKSYKYLGSLGMGYGYLPKFWHQQAEKLGLKVAIISSMHYEYRYHVILQK